MSEQKQRTVNLVEGQGASATIRNAALARGVSERGQSSANTISNAQAAQVSIKQSQQTTVPKQQDKS